MTRIFKLIFELTLFRLLAQDNNKMVSRAAVSYSVSVLGRSVLVGTLGMTY